MSTGSRAVVEIRQAWVTFGGRRPVQAVSGVDLDVARSEVVAIVGESGSGKSTLARAVVGLQRLTSGAIEFASPSGPYGRRQAQMVFQDPRSSLNPLLTIRQAMAESRPDLSAAEREPVIREHLRAVGISDEFMDVRAGDLSGGQCQRVSIARALMSSPELLVCDEVVSALDVSIQAQILDLLRTIREEQNVAMLFITHDLGVVRQLADRVAVMYLGEIVEVGPVATVFSRPTHPYTQALLSSAVDLAAPGAPRHKRLELSGTLPSPSNPPSGCRLHPRCWKAQEICVGVAPLLTDRVDGVTSACHFAEPLDVLTRSTT